MSGAQMGALPFIRVLGGGAPHGSTTYGCCKIRLQGATAGTWLLTQHCFVLLSFWIEDH